MCIFSSHFTKNQMGARHERRANRGASPPCGRGLRRKCSMRNWVRGWGPDPSPVCVYARPSSPLPQGARASPDAPRERWRLSAPALAAADASLVTRETELREPLFQIIAEHGHAEEIRRRALVVGAVGFGAQFGPVLDCAVAAAEPGERDEVDRASSCPRWRRGFPEPPDRPCGPPERQHGVIGGVGRIARIGDHILNVEFMRLGDEVQTLSGEIVKSGMFSGAPFEMTLVDMTSSNLAFCNGASQSFRRRQGFDSSLPVMMRAKRRTTVDLAQKTGRPMVKRSAGKMAA